MPDQLTDEQFDELLLEQDPFKLAIRGQMAIEADLDAAIAEAFGGDVPGEIRSARFGIRLALAVGLRIIPRDMKGLFERLANVRNDFAHGRVDDLTPQRARSLAGELRVVIGESVSPDFSEAQQRLAAMPPRATLAVTLRTARSIVRIAADARRRRQDEDRQIVAVHRALGRRQGGLAQALAREMQKEAAEHRARAERDGVADVVGRGHNSAGRGQVISRHRDAVHGRRAGAGRRADVRFLHTLWRG